MSRRRWFLLALVLAALAFGGYGDGDGLTGHHSHLTLLSGNADEMASVVNRDRLVPNPAGQSDLLGLMGRNEHEIAGRMLLLAILLGGIALVGGRAGRVLARRRVTSRYAPALAVRLRAPPGAAATSRR